MQVAHLQKMGVGLDRGNHRRFFGLTCQNRSSGWCSQNSSGPHMREAILGSDIVAPSGPSLGVPGIKPTYCIYIEHATHNIYMLYFSPVCVFKCTWH